MKQHQVVSEISTTFTLRNNYSKCSYCVPNSNKKKTKKKKKKKIPIRKFREILVSEWFNVFSENSVSGNHRKKTKKVPHHLVIRKNQEGKPIRRMCTLCYKKKKQTVSREEATKNIKKTTTQNHPKCVWNVLTNTMRYSIM